MKWIKAAIVGIAGALVMFALMVLGIHGTGIAPFNLPPSAAFLTSLGLNVGPLPLLVHLGYGATGSVVFVALYKEGVNLRRGLQWAGVLWLVMMTAYSPIIGWGFFGTADTSGLPEVMQLGSSVKYVFITLLLHVVYGTVLGWGNATWITDEASESVLPDTMS
jgi:hypothetical protein